MYKIIAIIERTDKYLDTTIYPNFYLKKNNKIVPLDNILTSEPQNRKYIKYVNNKNISIYHPLKCFM
jgi:hypothetical protein